MKEKPKREDYASDADYHFWICAWQHDEIKALVLRAENAERALEQCEKELEEVRIALRAVVINPAILHLAYDYSPETTLIHNVINTLRKVPR
jgi:hypothetical protein